MIAGQPGDSSRPHQVQAAISHVREVQISARYRHRGTGCAHAKQLGVLAGMFSNTLVSSPHPVDQQTLRSSGTIGEGLAYGLDRDLAGLLAAFVAPHTISHNREPSLVRQIVGTLRLPIGRGIFVALPLAANV